MPARAMLLQNLRHPDYRDTVYGGHGEQDMTRRFSEVDRALPAKALQSWKADRSGSRLPRKLERMDDLHDRLLALVKAACPSTRKKA